MLSRVALPLAQASGALYRVETDPGARTESDLELARACIRTVLAALQETNLQKAASERALENVAACLGLTHELSQLLKAAPAPMIPMPAGPAYDPARPVSAAAQLPGPGKSPLPYPDFSLESTAAVPMHPPGNMPNLSAPPLSSTQNSPGVQKKPKTTNSGNAAHLESTQVSRGGPNEQEWERAAQGKSPAGNAGPSPIKQGVQSPVGKGPPTARSSDRLAAGGGSGTLQSAGQAPRSGEAQWAAPTSRHAPGPPVPPEPGAVRVEANLGTHSPTNFYKGLRGNDVVDHGGLFVATYEGPGVGTPLFLRVTLPGGYSFDASAVVRWTRRQGGGDTPPGFGATFVSISAEARQLVYRFTKNREPLFHDDI